MNHELKRSGIILGFPFAVVHIDNKMSMFPHGHYCGYVGVSKNHPLYGKDYDDEIEGLERYASKKSNTVQSVIENHGAFGLLAAISSSGDDENLRLSYAVECHGGLTYSNNDVNYPMKMDVDTWWFGFDCMHCDDSIETCHERYVESECYRLAVHLYEIGKFLAEESIND